MDRAVQNVFLVGAKSLGAYGGYETFVDKLTEYHQDNSGLKYHVACKANGDGCMNEEMLKNAKKLSDSEFLYHNARCFRIRVPDIGSAQAIYYDIAALNRCCEYIRRNNIRNPIVYIMACRIGPFAGYFRRRIHRLGGRVYLNPDGHEWMRAKWSAPVRWYWKLSERLMIRNCDLAVCDSASIEKYIHSSYDGRGRRKSDPKSVFIAYGAETRKSTVSDDDAELLKWYSEKKLSAGEYYLVVGRFVPENNYETMIREFMSSRTDKSFAIITNVNDRFLDELESRLHFRQDSRIKFVGTVYNQELLMKLRENAFGYFHGHEVGGTNPSLLEALGSTKLNLLLDVEFNREVAGDAALYWTKKRGSLAALIARADAMDEECLSEYGEKAKARIRSAYSWQYIADRYERLFLKSRSQSDSDSNGA